MKTRNYRTELKALTTEELEKAVDSLLNRLLDRTTTGSKEWSATPLRTKHAYAVALLEKRRAELEAKINAIDKDVQKILLFRFIKSLPNDFIVWQENLKRHIDVFVK